MDAVAFPLIPHRRLGIAGSILALGYGGLIIGLLPQVPLTSFSFVMYHLIWPAIGLLFVIAGAVGMIQCLTTVHLTPGRVELTLCGKVYRRYPLENLKTFCMIQQGLAKYQSTHLCICTQSVEELAARQDAKHHGDARARQNAALRRRTTWQEAYAGDYLRQKLQSVHFTIPGRELVWLGFRLESLALLRQTYPDIPWLIAPEAQSSPMRYSEDSDSTSAVFPDTKKRLVFDTHGVHLVHGDRRQLLNAADIRTIVCMDRLVAGGGYYQKYLILSSEAPTQQDQPDIWFRLALRAACIRRNPMMAYWKKDMVTAPWFAAREEALRALYPEADYFDCTNETLFRAIFAQGDNGHA